MNFDAKLDVIKVDWPKATVKINNERFEIEFDDYELIDDHDTEGKDLAYIGEDEEGNTLVLATYNPTFHYPDQIPEGFEYTIGRNCECVSIITSKC